MSASSPSTALSWSQSMLTAESPLGSGRSPVRAPTTNASHFCATISSQGPPAKKSRRSSRSTLTTPLGARPLARVTRTSSRRCSSAWPRSRATSSSSRRGGHSSRLGRTSSPHGRIVRGCLPCIKTHCVRMLTHFSSHQWSSGTASKASDTYVIS